MDRRKGMNATEAKRLAELSGGQIKKAFEALDELTIKPVVLLALRAFREHDAAALDRLADKWSDEHTSLLVKWCTESVTDRWALFSEAESELPGRSLPLKILMALSADIRPRLVVRSSLMSVLRGPA